MRTEGSWLEWSSSRITCCRLLLVLCCASVCAMGEDLAACFCDPIISRSGRNHARIDVVKLLAVQDVGRADVRVLERRERHVVSGDRAAVHNADIRMNLNPAVG